MVIFLPQKCGTRGAAGQGLVLSARVGWCVEMCRRAGRVGVARLRVRGVVGKAVAGVLTRVRGVWSVAGLPLAALASAWPMGQSPGLPITDLGLAVGR
jgi:hypothetical protein